MIFMKNDLLKSLFIVAAVVAGLALPVRSEDSKDTEPLIMKLPIHTLKGTPSDLPTGPNIEPPSDIAPKPLQVPKGVKNVAAGRPVTSSVPPFLGELSQLTDGKMEANDEDAFELKKGVQWVQVDLGQSFAIHAVAMWHDHRYVQSVRDVILQVSEDPEFKAGVTTLYNNDTDNSAGQGVGTDREYFEMEYGRVVPAKGVKARYVRGYSKGSNQSALNCWQEMQVYALPAK